MNCLRPCSNDVEEQVKCTLGVDENLFFSFFLSFLSNFDCHIQSGKEKKHYWFFTQRFGKVKLTTFYQVLIRKLQSKSQMNPK